MVRFFEEAMDPALAELRRKVADIKPYEPQPGDPDYLTPEQVARIKRDRQRERIV